MQKKLWKMILIVTIPLMLIIILVVGVALGYGLQYNSILNNVTTASDFNRDFTDNIKTKMYYYVIDSQYSEGMPTEEVKSAEAIALKLIETTAEKDSLRAINSVLNLCHNLEDKMQEIAITSGLRFPHEPAQRQYLRHGRPDSGIHVHLSVLRGGASGRAAKHHDHQHGGADGRDCRARAGDDVLPFELFAKTQPQYRRADRHALRAPRRHRPGRVIGLRADSGGCRGGAAALGRHREHGRPPQAAHRAQHRAGKAAEAHGARAVAGAD